jgi:hypothetical protein
MDENLTSTTSPIPQIAISPTPAPGLRGPSGISPRQNFSRVNTGSPEGSDAGGLGQKSIMPKVGSIMFDQISMATRPRGLNDMLKTAMESTASRAKIAEEAKRQLANLEGKDEEEEDKGKKEKDSCMKAASADTLPTDYVLKLAAAVDYVVELLKEGADLGGPYTLKENVQGAGLGPSVLTVTPTMPENPPHVIHVNSGQAGTNKVDPKIELQKAQPVDGTTQVKNDKDRAPGTGDPPVSGSTKNASAPAPLALLRSMWKQAEDAINPAQIAAGPEVPPDVSVSGEPGPAAEGKDRVPATAQGVADETRRDAKSVPKQEMGKLLDEPMMSAAHDNVLQQAFTHTNEAGAKVSSAQVKLAAAKALLSNLANGGSK